MVDYQNIWGEFSPRPVDASNGACPWYLTWKAGGHREVGIVWRVVRVVESSCRSCTSSVRLPKLEADAEEDTVPPRAVRLPPRSGPQNQKTQSSKGI